MSDRKKRMIALVIFGVIAFICLPPGLWFAVKFFATEDVATFLLFELLLGTSGACIVCFVLIYKWKVEVNKEEEKRLKIKIRKEVTPYEKMVERTLIRLGKTLGLKKIKLFKERRTPYLSSLSHLWTGETACVELFNDDKIYNLDYLIIHVGFLPEGLQVGKDDDDSKSVKRTRGFHQEDLVNALETQ